MVFQDSKIIFLGTPDFAVPVLEKLISSQFKPSLVITQPDKPVGRKQVLTPSPVKQLAVKSGIAVAQPKTKSELADLFLELKVDVCILVAYGMIIPAAVLAKPKFGFINLHPSKLPAYRGPAPIQASLLNGDKETAVTIMQLNDQVDAGPIISQAAVAILPNDNYLSLAQKLSGVGADLIVKILPDYLAGKIELVEQNHSAATTCKMIKRDDGLVDWSKSANQIYRQFKAFYPWPGLFTHLAGKRLKITDLAVLEGDFGSDLAFGTVYLGPNGELAVKCNNSAIQLISVQLEGKKVMPGKEFLAGQKKLIGKILN